MNQNYTIDLLIKASIILLLLVGVALRVINLDANPTYYQWIGYITDEGRWTEQARNFSLFGQLSLQGLRMLHVVMGSGFQLLTYLSFELFGVGFWPARLISAICGSGILLTFLLVFRQYFTASAFALGLTILALDPDMLGLSRIAIPEIPALLFSLLTFQALIPEKSPNKSLLLAGVLMAVTLSIKATTIFILPVFILIIIAINSTQPWKTIFFRVSLFLSVLVILAIIIFSSALIFNLISIDRLLQTGNSVSSFIRLSKLYRFIGFLFNSGFVYSINFMILLSWFNSVAILNKGQLLKTSLGKIYIASAIWWVAWLILAMALEYFPPRYVLHIIVPLAIHTAAGLTLVQKQDSGSIDKWLSGLTGFHKYLFTLCLVLPISILLAPSIISIIAAFDASLVKLTSKFLAIAILAFLFTGVLATQPLNRHQFNSLRFIPVFFALLWLVLSKIHLIGPNFWKFESIGSSLLWGGLILLVFSILLNSKIQIIHTKITETVSLLSIVVLILMFSASQYNTVFKPSYTIKNVSSVVQRYLGNDISIQSIGAESIFLGNTQQVNFTHFRTKHKPDAIVVWRPRPKVLSYIKLAYTADMEIKIKFDETFRKSNPNRKNQEQDSKIIIYKKKN